MYSSIPAVLVPFGRAKAMSVELGQRGGGMILIPAKP